MLQARSNRHQEAVPEQQPVEFTFVQCAQCRQWRRLPADVPAPEGWQCASNPDSR